MNGITKTVTDLINHLPAGIRDELESGLTLYLLGKIDISKFVGTLNPTTFAVLAAAVDAHRAQKTGV